MCGICGSTADPEGVAVEAMSAALIHRGPDDEGAYTDPAAGVSLGVRRLSIIDVPGGHQPITNEDGTVWTVFNGEIYNFPALRERLLAAGHELASRADTEVLPHLYEEYGDDLVHALEGMFAFAIWDAKRERLLIGRDRFGEKPLFYSEAGGKLVFASELTALTRGLPNTPDVDPFVMHAFYVHGYVPGRNAIVEGVRQLRPGSLLTWETSSRRASERTYWTPPVPNTTNREPMPELAAEAGRLLKESIRGRLLADVPLGIFLSGGVDSTVIGAIAAQESSSPIRSFTVGYDVAEGGDERGEARRIAALIGSDHQDLLLTSGDTAARVPRLLASLDQPLADSAIVPLHAVAEFARREITVAIAGEGADELFGGYPRYAWLERAAQAWPRGLDRRFAALGILPPARAAAGRARRVLDLAVPRPIVERHLDWVTGGRRTTRASLYGPALQADRDSRHLLEGMEAIYGSGASSVAGAFMHMDQRHWLPDDVLVKADRAGMLVSLEVRTPYLQRELAEFAASVSPHTHVRRNGKQILRALLGQLVPGAPQRRKVAFLPPVAAWLRGPLLPAVHRQIAHGSLYAEGWFRRDPVAQILRSHAAHQADWSHVLWPLLAAGLWLDRYRGLDGGG